MAVCCQKYLSAVIKLKGESTKGVTLNVYTLVHGQACLCFFSCNFDTFNAAHCRMSTVNIFDKKI